MATLHRYHQGPQFSPEDKDFDYLLPVQMSEEGKRDRLLLGLELEMVAMFEREQCLAEVDQVLGDYVKFEQDGSLPRGGFEMISRPATVQEHTARMGAFFEQRDWWQARYGLTSTMHDECGMHVHLDRAFLGKEGLAKLDWLLNDPGNRAAVQELAQRKANDYAVFSQEDQLHPLNGDELLRGRERTSVLNINPHKTVEFRLGKGVDDKLDFMKTLEFISAAALYAVKTKARTPEMLREKLTMSAFIADVFQSPPNQNTYLKRWVLERGSPELKALTQGRDTRVQMGMDF